MTIDNFHRLNNPRIGERLKEVRLSEKLSQDEVAKRFQITRQTYMRYESWERIPDAEFLTKFIAEFNLNANWLLFGIENMRMFNESGETNEFREFRKIPIIGTASCGFSGQILDKDIEGYKAFEIKYLSKFNNPILTRARGDSMLPIIVNGDLLLCDRSIYKRQHPDPKRIYLVNHPDSIDEVAIKVKKISFTGKTLTLIPLNSAYPPIALDVDGKSILDVVLGEIVWIGREIN